MPRHSPVTDQMHLGDSRRRESLEQGLRRAWQLVDERQPLRLVLSQLTAIAESLSADIVLSRSCCWTVKDSCATALRRTCPPITWTPSTA